MYVIHTIIMLFNTYVVYMYMHMYMYNVCFYSYSMCTNYLLCSSKISSKLSGGSMSDAIAAFKELSLLSDGISHTRCSILKQYSSNISNHWRRTLKDRLSK